MYVLLNNFSYDGEFANLRKFDLICEAGFKFK
jgi:hypothetical protein